MILGLAQPARASRQAAYFVGAAGVGGGGGGAREVIRDGLDEMGCLVAALVQPSPHTLHKSRR